MATKRVPEKKVLMSSSAGAAPARRKSAPPQRAPRTMSAAVSSTPEAVSHEYVDAQSVIEITNEAVAELAYSYWVARGGQGGSPEEDWLRAEQELRADISSK